MSSEKNIPVSIIFSVFINAYRYALLIIPVFLWMPGSAVIGQETHNSQFYFNPLNLNPSLTGHFDGDWRASVTYRNQWRSIAVPYNTGSVSFDRQFYLYSQKISGGLLYVNDVSGDISLKVNKLYFSGAYHYTINDHELHIGIQPGVVMKSINYDKLTFPDQFDMGSGTYNGTLPTGENGDGERLTYIDLNVGITWNTRIGIFEPEAGAGLLHLNSPKESFYNNDNRKPLQTVMHAKLKTNIGEELFVEPALFMMAGRKASDMIIGARAGIQTISSATSIREVHAGIFVRNGIGLNTDALIVNIGMIRRNLQLGISYDLNVSPLSEASGSRGAFELTLIYQSISTILNSYSIPCERF